MAPILLLVLMCLILPATLGADETAPPATAAGAASTSDEVGVFDEVWRTVNEHFYDPRFHGLDWAALAQRYRPAAAAASTAEERSAVINQMLSELAASHTRHYTAADPAYYQLLDIFSRVLKRPLQRFFPEGQVTYSGIGIFTRSIDGKTFVSGVLAGLPAARTGLAVGDELLTVDGATFQPIGSFAAKVGHEVRLTIRRHADGPPQDVLVAPQQIAPQAAFLKAMESSARIIEVDSGKIGYIHVWSYAGAQFQQLLERELFSGALKDADALVWDVRDGWGGAEADYLNLFGGSAPTTELINRAGQRSLAAMTWRKPVAMLINNGTRSGKEILAYGFKKYGLGEVIGSPTAGAVLAGRAFLLSDSSLLLVAVADVRVDGQRLEGVGVTPTIVVPFSLPYAQGRDPQLQRAVEVLSQALGAGG